MKLEKEKERETKKRKKKKTRKIGRERLLKNTSKSLFWLLWRNENDLRALLT